MMPGWRDQISSDLLLFMTEDERITILAICFEVDADVVMVDILSPLSFAMQRDMMGWKVRLQMVHIA